MNIAIRRILNRSTAVVLTATLFLGVIQSAIVRANPATSLSKSGSTEVGKTVSVNVKVSGDGPYSGFTGSVSYDGDYLELSEIAPGNYGTTDFSAKNGKFLDYDCNIPSGSTIAVIKFKCLKEGSTKVSVSVTASSMAGSDFPDSGASANINISAPVVLSGNNYLSSLSVAPGTLSPSFNKDTQSYHVTVSESTTSIAVTATAEHSAAKVSLNGVQKDLARGDNTVKVTVTAENGDTRTYKIYVTRGTPTPTPEPYPVISCNDHSYTILEKGSLEEVPSGFSWSETTYNSKKIPCLVGPDGTLLLWLLSDSGNGLYVYDLNKQTVSPCYAYTNEVVSMMIMPFPEGFVVPNGYEKSTYTYNEHEVEVYKNTEHPEQPMLIYLMGAEGKQTMYYLDGETGLIMPFRGDISELLATPTPLPTDTPTPTPTPEPTNTVTATPTATPEPEETGINFYKTLSILLGVFCAGLLAMVIIMAILRNKERKELLGLYDEDADIEETDEDEYEEDSEEEIEEGDHYYQFGDEEAPAPRRPGAKRAGDEDPKQAVKEVVEEKKEEPLPDFPEFPEKKPEPVIEPEIPTPVINVIEDRIDKSKDQSDDNSDDEDGDQEGKGDDGEI